jgi:hypothetical protein
MPNEAVSEKKSTSRRLPAVNAVTDNTVTQNVSALVPLKASLRYLSWR